MRKHYFIFLLFPLLFLNGCHHSNHITKNTVFTEPFDMSTPEKDIILNEEQIKIKTLEWIEKHFQERLYLNTLSMSIERATNDWIQAYSNDYQAMLRQKYEAFQKEFFDFGYYGVSFIIRKMDEDQEGYYLQLTPKTGDVLFFSYTTAQNTHDNERLDFDYQQAIVNEFVYSIFKNEVSLQSTEEIDGGFMKGTLFTYKTTANEPVAVFIQYDSNRVNWYARGIMVETHRFW